MYGKDLVEELDDELRGHLEDLIIRLMASHEEHDAIELRHAMKGLGTEAKLLIEILCTRSNRELAAVKKYYENALERDLEKDVAGDTSGQFKKLLLQILECTREESLRTDPFLAKNTALAMCKGGEKELGSDDSVLIFATENFGQLQAIFDEYKLATRTDIVEAVEKAFSGDIKDALITIIKRARNRPAYFAEALHNAMEGAGTKDTDLIRIMVSRCDIDGMNIKCEYQRLYGTPLEKDIADDTSGKYRDALLALVQGNVERNSESG